jgi:hypothetical protein
MLASARRAVGSGQLGPSSELSCVMPVINGPLLYFDVEDLGAFEASLRREDDDFFSEIRRELSRDKYSALANVAMAVKSRTATEAAPKLPRRPRKARVHTLIKQAEKSGKPVTSITTPDGVTLHFGKDEQQQGNEVDEWIAKHANKTQRH